MNNPIRIGSRGSDLALWQAHFFQDQLKNIGVPSEIIIISTKGDRIQHLSFDKIEGKGFFTKEIEEALYNHEIDVAIHSHKDLETHPPQGLVIAGVSYREDPSELLLIHPDAVDHSLPLHFKQNAIVGTSSARRKSQISALRPDITIKDIRGNVPTRVNKLRNKEFDAILLANAGVSRLQLSLEGLLSEVLDPRYFIPAPAQGVLAYQCRAEDQESIDIIQQLHQPEIQNAIAIERGILSNFGDGCQVPIGVFAQPDLDGFSVWTSYGSAWDAFPSRVRFQASDAEDALLQFERMKSNPLPSTVFISKDLDGNNYFSRAAQNAGINVLGKSLIQTLPASFRADKNAYEWVVFSSSNGVDAFFQQERKEDWMTKKFGVAGEGTARALAKHGVKAHFIGRDSNMQMVAEKLAQSIGHAKTLFPSSEKSLGSLQQSLDPKQCTCVVCYTTSSAPAPIPPCDAYIFTSPSNVDSFCVANPLPLGKQVIAIGAATAAKLQALGLRPVTAAIPSETELFALLASEIG